MIFERTYIYVSFWFHTSSRCQTYLFPPAHHAEVIIGFRGYHEGVGAGDKESRAHTIKSGWDKTMFAPPFLCAKKLKKKNLKIKHGSRKCTRDLRLKCIL